MRFELIKGNEDYIIFENGSIFNCITDRFLVIKNGKDFYRTVRLRKNGVAKTHKLHRLLAEAFKYKPTGKNYVNHIDGNKLNNSLYNLEWVTHGENMRHAAHIGLLYQSEANKIALIEAKQKAVINTQYGIFYESIKSAAQSIGLKPRHLSSMLNGRLRNKTNLSLCE